MKRSLWLLMLFLLAGHVPAASADSACEGRFVNPITDICWSCIFPLSLGSIKVSQGIRDSEIQNFCLHGTVGAGKSEVIRRLANYARQRGDMVVIYDRSGEFVKSYYDPSIDKILNPLDARCA
ncbi:type IV secretion system DNA-binding domain-containing protein, partial [Escherichia coli]|nr:type IV secretion system DNA-binding domain-containing protein [Escherichia coli]